MACMCGCVVECMIASMFCCAVECLIAVCEVVLLSV